LHNLNLVGTRPEPPLSPKARAVRAIYEAELRRIRIKAVRVRRVEFLKWLLLGTPRPVFRPVPLFVLRRADAAMRAGNLHEAVSRCEEYITAADGLDGPFFAEMITRRLAFLYSRLGRLSDAVREYERLADHYLRKTPPDARKAHAAQVAVRRLQGMAAGSENG
jgi:hypothetical protein